MVSTVNTSTGAGSGRSGTVLVSTVGAGTGTGLPYLSGGRLKFEALCNLSPRCVLCLLLSRLRRSGLVLRVAGSCAWSWFCRAITTGTLGRGRHGSGACLQGDNHRHTWQGWQLLPVAHNTSGQALRSGVGVALSWVGSGCRYLGSGCRYLGSGCRYLGSGCRYLGSECRYLGSGSRPILFAGKCGTESHLPKKRPKLPTFPALCQDAAKMMATAEPPANPYAKPLPAGCAKTGCQDAAKIVF